MIIRKSAFIENISKSFDKCLLESLLTDDISKGHDVILGEGESFYLGQLPGLVDMGDHLSQVLRGRGGCNGNGILRKGEYNSLKFLKQDYVC